MLNLTLIKLLTVSRIISYLHVWPHMEYEEIYYGGCVIFLMNVLTKPE